MKKNNLVMIIGIIAVVVVLAFVLRLVSRQMNRNIGERIAEKIIEKGTGGKVNIDTGSGKFRIEGKGGTIEFKQENKWPADLPGVFPEFKYGQVKGVTRSTVDQNKNWTVSFENVAPEAYEKYKKDLKAKGFELTVVETDEGGSISGQKANHLIFALIDTKTRAATINAGVNKE